ncbi:hypothetical protein [Luteibacter sp. SG786]|uniref:hypothetical protein n=1 Tax=Luteibacter sp. SG786 TaxID=2587130 RepID=UPI001422E205|nr:hypothetical protein [Luteibacter sp. SG786]NII54359.1 hypothetical protein [Luteibacter sp. SG786]
MHENDPSSDLKAARDTARLLYDDALETESQVAGLMEALEELLPIADSSETNGPAEWARIHEAREALSKFRGGV